MIFFSFLFLGGGEREGLGYVTQASLKLYDPPAFVEYCGLYFCVLCSGKLMTCISSFVFCLGIFPYVFRIEFYKYDTLFGQSKVVKF
jgi:hypothetical protein